MVNIEDKLHVLQELGFAKVPHTSSTLFNHMHGTYLLLQSWGVEKYVCDAGLYHAVYDTRHNCLGTIISDKQRYAVQLVIGDKAEALVYLFCKMDQNAFYKSLLNDSPKTLSVNLVENGKTVELDKIIISDMCNIFAANWLEQASRNALPTNGKIKPMLIVLKHYLNPKAFTQVNEVACSDSKYADVSTRDMDALS